MTLIRCSLILVVLTILSSSGLLAQVTTGAPPFGTVDNNGGGPDLIDQANLNIHLTIPVLHQPGRGTDFTYDLSYDSSVWYPVTSNGTTSWQPVSNWGWRGQTDAATGHISYQLWIDSQPHCVYYYYQNWVYYDSGGAPHPFSGSGSAYSGGNSQYCGSRYFTGFSNTANDGSGYSITVPSNSTGAFPGATVYDKNGNTYSVPINIGSGPASLSDRNGNEITVNGSGNFYSTLSSTNAALTVSGSGTTTSPMQFSYTAPSLVQASYTLNYTNYTVATDFGWGINEYRSSAPVPLVTSVVLPDGSQYNIQYEATPSLPTGCTPYAGTTCVTARVKSITLPSGGTITYAYSGGRNGILQDGSTAGVTRTTPDGTWTYSRNGLVLPTTTTIIDPQGNLTNMEFQGTYETQRVVNQGSSTVLETVNTCYNGSASPCTGTAVSLPILSKTVTTILPGSSNLESKVASTYNIYGQLTEEDDYDFGSGAPASLLRKKLNTIQTVGNYQAIQQTQIQDGSGNVVSKTTMTFDQGSVTTTSGTQQHQNPTVGRGNPTTISYVVQGSTSLTKTLTYFDTGNVQSVTDVNGGTTTYTYSNSTATCGNSFPTGQIEAISSLTQSYVWNCVGGVLTQTTDENGKTVVTSYTDADFWRPAWTNDQEGNGTTFYYSPNPSYPTVFNIGSFLTFNGGSNGASSEVSDINYMDGLGRAYDDQKLQSPTSSTLDTVSYTFDPAGRLYTVSVPCATGYMGTCPTAQTVTIYDGLGRPTEVADVNLGTTKYLYPQNDVLITRGPAPSGENTKQRQLEYDGLGRLTSVCEITTSLPGYGTCGQSSPQQGYWTKYTYDANGNLTGVTQNAQATSGQQTRSYSYDDLSRMTSETNPESGTTTYQYDSSSICWGGSSGDLTVHTDNAGNVTCFNYDKLHRLTDISGWKNNTWSTVGNGPCRRFRYDATGNGAVSPPSGSSQSNISGRVVEAETDACTVWPPTPITDVWFSYTPRGEVSDLWESTPHSGGYYHSYATYWANGVLNTLTGVPASGTGYGAAWNTDGEGRVSSTYNTYMNPLTGTNYNNAGQPTQVNLGSGDSDSFSYLGTGQMSQYTYSVNGRSVVGALNWNANGSLGSLAITDPFNSANGQICNYSHDDLERIASANCGSIWSQTFAYDAFGNLDKTGNSSFNPSYSSSTNHMTQIGSQIPTYDANGNVTNDFLNSYSWDGYGRPLTIQPVGSTAVGLTYDALGRMVEQNRAGAYTSLFYSPTGFMMETMNGSAVGFAFVPLTGGETAVYNSGGLAYYRHRDWEGSSRFTSTPSRGMYGDQAYAPFGEVYAQAGTPDFSFTGMDQDTTSTVYDFPEREYGIQGRWPSPDPAGLSAVDPTNPQSWNLYAYVMNNPLSSTDPTGLDPCPPDTPTSVCVSAPPPSVCDPNWGSCTVAGDGAGNGMGGGVVGPVYCGANAQCGKSDTATCVASQIANGRSSSACFGAPAGAPQTTGAQTKPQTPWYNTCGAQAAGNFALHGGVDAIGLLPGIGDVSEAAIGALGLTAGYGVALMDAATPGGLTNGGAAMQGTGTALFVVDASKTSIVAVTRIAAVARVIPVANKFFALASLGLDAYKTYQDYQACKAGR